MNLSKRQLSLFRGNGGGMTPLQIALAKFGFYAPLTTDVFLDRGYGAASFTRATTATVKDWEGAIRNCVSGEVRFAGQRRVRNLLTTSENLDAWGKSNCTITSGITDPDGGSTAFTMTATAGGAQLYAGLAGNTFRASIWMRRRTGTGLVAIYVDDSSGSTQVTLTTSWQRFSPSPQSAGNPYMSIWLETSGDEVDLWHPMYEEVVGQSNQNPSEYVSVGAAKLNELLQSEQFDTTWANFQSSESRAGDAAPNGAATAWRLIEDASAATIHANTQTVTTIVATYTFSVYAKAGTRSKIELWSASNAARGFDLSAGTTFANTIGALEPTSSAIEDAGNGWYRCSMTFTGTAAANGHRIYLNDGTDVTYNGDGASYAIIWGAQLERAAAASTYFPVGSVYPYHGACVDGVKYFATENGNTVASNVVTEATGAAIDQTNVGYLAESARTNLVLQSSNFGTSWLVVGTPTRSAAAAYCGEIALDLIGDDDAGAAEEYYQQIAFTADASKSVSFLVKQGTSTSTVVAVYDTVVAYRLLMAITWSGGVPVCTYTNGSAERASEYMGGGVWRIFCLAAGVVAANVNIIRVYPATTAAFAVANTGDIYIGGVQAENATTASASHIPTTTATVTRNADSLSVPTVGNVLTSVGSCYAEVKPQMIIAATTPIFIGVSGSDAALYFASDGTLGFYDGSGGTGVITTSFIGRVTKTAIAYSGAAASISADALITSAASFDGSINGGSTLYLGGVAGRELNGIMKNARLATVALTNADLQLITA